MITEIQFVVPGIPAPGGSKKAFMNQKTGRIIVTDDCKRNKDWRSLVAMAAMEAKSKVGMTGLFVGPIYVEMEFRMLRPKAHYRTGKFAGQLKPGAGYWHKGKPDVLKLARSTEDALTGVIWADDSQTYSLVIRKIYHQEPGCLVTVDCYDGCLSEADEDELDRQIKSRLKGFVPHRALPGTFPACQFALRNDPGAAVETE